MGDPPSRRRRYTGNDTRRCGTRHDTGRVAASGDGRHAGRSAAERMRARRPRSGRLRRVGPLGRTGGRVQPRLPGCGPGRTSRPGRTVWEGCVLRDRACRRSRVRRRSRARRRRRDRSRIARRGHRGSCGRRPRLQGGGCVGDSGRVIRQGRTGSGCCGPIDHRRPTGPIHGRRRLDLLGLGRGRRRDGAGGGGDGVCRRYGPGAHRSLRQGRRGRGRLGRCRRPGARGRLHHPGRQQHHRVDVRVRGRPDPDTEMHVGGRPFHLPARPGGPYRIAFGDRVSFRHGDAAEMRQRDRVPVRRLNRHGAAMGGDDAREGDVPRHRRPNGLPRPAPHIDTSVLSRRIGIGTERVRAQDGATERPRPCPRSRGEDERCSDEREREGETAHGNDLLFSVLTTERTVARGSDVVQKDYRDCLYRAFRDTPVSCATTSAASRRGVPAATRSATAETAAPT